MAQTLQTLVEKGDAEVGRLDAQASAMKAQVVEFSSRWADAEHQWRYSQSEVEVVRSESLGLRERLIAAELRRNRLFADLYLIREERDRFWERLALLQKEAETHLPEAEVQSTEAGTSERRELNGLVRRGRSLVAPVLRRVQSGSKRFLRISSE